MAPTPSPILSNIPEPHPPEQQPRGSLLNPSLLAWVTLPVLAYLLIGLFLSHRAYPTPWRNRPEDVNSFTTDTQYPLWLREAVRDAAPFISDQQKNKGRAFLVVCKGVMIKMAWHLVGATIWPLILFWEGGMKLVRGTKRSVHQVGSVEEGRGGRMMSDDDEDETPNTPLSDENLTRIVIRKRPRQTKKECGQRGSRSTATTTTTTAGAQSRRRRRTRHETGAALQRFPNKSIANKKETVISSKQKAAVQNTISRSMIRTAGITTASTTANTNTTMNDGNKNTHTSELQEASESQQEKAEQDEDEISSTDSHPSEQSFYREVFDDKDLCRHNTPHAHHTQQTRLTQNSQQTHLNKKGRISALDDAETEQEKMRLKEKFSRENPLGILVPDLVGASSSFGIVRYYCPRPCPRPCTRSCLNCEEKPRDLTGVKCGCASVRKAWSLDDMRSMRSMSEKGVQGMNGEIHSSSSSRSSRANIGNSTLPEQKQNGGGGGGGRATQQPSKNNAGSGFAINGACGDGRRPPPLLPPQRRRSFERHVNGAYPEGRIMAPERRSSKNNGNGAILNGNLKTMKKRSRSGSKHDLRPLGLGTIYEEDD